ncbi:hypothetical protein [Vulgatibacter sp.]|uniref:hypothetical protein n=1 Tax=Vulgatibacter sp. TaxID=1971226 RepID=UPI00356574EA
MSKRWIPGSAAALAIGVLLLAIGLALEPRRALFSWLVAWLFVVTTATGSLVLLMVTHAARARWFAVVRRLAEVAASALPVLLLLAAPIFLGVGELYRWAAPLDGLGAEERELIVHKRPWLDEPLFVARAIFFLGSWSIAAWLLGRWSLAQDRTGSAALQIRMQRFSSGMLPFMALSVTFASFDWAMSLQPSWLSTVFGIYFLVGGFVAALALLCAAAIVAGRRPLDEVISTAHRHALGKLLFAAVVFWAYIAFVQFLLQWITDMPREVEFWLHRTEGGWRTVTLLLVAAHFVVPFFFLLPRRTKRRPLPLAAAAAWLLAAHWLDLYWLVMPALSPHGPMPHWLDLAALLATCGATSLFVALRWRNRPLLATGDVHFEQALRYRGS